MIRSGLFVAWSTAILLGLADSGSANAQEKKTTGKQVSKSEKETVAPDFAKSLGLPFDSVQTLGLRLTETRRKSDPITLALISTEVALAEKVSNKKAELTAEDLQKEAVELVKLRAIDTELRAMSFLVKDVEAAKELTKLANSAQEAEVKRISDFKLGVDSRGVHYLEVTNRTGTWAEIRIDGQNVGAVPPFRHQEFHVPQHWHERPLTLAAHDRQGLRWRAIVLTGKHVRWHWILEP